MIDSVFPISLNGVKYRIATDMGEDAYLAATEPLRAPTNGIVQGTSGKFQLRPDILEWRYTDFSGGEGRLVWSQENAAQYYRGYNVDPFEVFGTLRLARGLEVTQDSTGAADFTPRTRIVTAGQKLLAFVATDAATDGGVYVWDGTKWGTLTSNTTGGSTFGNKKNIALSGNSRHGYYHDSAAKIQRYIISSATFDQLYNRTATGWVLSSLSPTLVNKYLYAAEGNTPHTGVFRVVEIDTTASLPVTAGTVVYTTESYGDTNELRTKWGPRMTTGPNAVFLMTHSKADEMVLHRITPSTAAATGFGEEVYRISGFQGQGLFYMGGLVYMAGLMGGRPVIMYYDDVNSSYGVVISLDGQKGSWQDGASWVFSSFESASGFMGAFMFLTGPNSTDDEFTLLLINQITGGVATSSVRASGAVTRSVVEPELVWFGGELFFIDINSGGNRVIRQRKDTYTTSTGIWESSVHDMDIAEDKILLSFKLVTDPLPASTSVVVKYQLDQDGTWLTAGTHDTDSSSEAEFIISTGAATKTFRNLQIRLELTGTSSATPVVRSIRAWSTVAKKVRVWQLTVDVSDEDGQAQDRSWNGEKLLSNLVTAGDAGTVITLLDGMKSRDPNVYDTYNVTVEQYTKVQRAPGEGLVRLLLKESL